MIERWMAEVTERFATFQRDVKMLSNALRGQRPPLLVKQSGRHLSGIAGGPHTQPGSFLERTPLTEATGSRSAAARTLAPRTVTVTELIRETPQAVTLVVRESSEAAFEEAFGLAAGSRARFAPGQFVTLVVQIDGVEYRRAYSISSTESELPLWSITIKRVRDGKVSNFLNEKITVGSALSVLGPSGSFVLGDARCPAGEKRSLLFVAGGSGITPIFSMIRSLLASDAYAHATLVYGNYDRESVIFDAPLRALARAHPERFSLITVLEKPGTDEVDVIAGRLDKTVFERVFAALALPAYVECFVCGPEPMMDATREVLLARGIAREAIREEKFSSPQRRPQDAQVPGATQTFQATFVLNGKPRLVTIQPGKLLLESGIEAGLDLPFSCTMGGCGACKSRLVAGRVSMQEPNCLLPSEEAEGDILPCVSTCLSDVRLEVAS
jgi:ferredoxin-NADP reductase